MTRDEWRARRPRACCRDGAHLIPFAVAPGGEGVAQTAGELCIAPAVDGLRMIPMRGPVCGRRHFYGVFRPGHYGATPQPLTLGGS